MLRFGSSPASKSRRAIHPYWRLWMLVFILGVVTVMMQRIDRPATVERLDQLLRRPTDGTIAAPRAPVATDFDLSAIQDNTYFHPVEQKAWFEMFARLRDSTPEQMARMTLGELTYAQLLQQPDVYRGQLVTLHGTVLRAEEQKPEENSLGISQYHRLWLQPRGGGEWPFVVYALTLPGQFPRGDKLRAEASVTGYFFKNWSYEYDGGLGLAPVVLAGAIDWQQPATPTPQPTMSTRDITWLIAGAGVFALASLWFIVHNSTRKPQSNIALPDIITLPAELAAEPTSGERP